MESAHDTTQQQERPAADGGDVLSDQMQEELRVARRCFVEIERLSQLMSGYPPGHPRVEGGIESLEEAFYEFFELTDRLTVQVHPHWMDLYGAGEMVWETEDPKDYCFVLNRDGIYLLHILAGVDGAELQRFVTVLNELVDQRNLEQDAVTLLFDAGFKNIHWEAIDESLAQLAGLESDIKNRDTPEEQEMIEELMEGAIDQEDIAADSDDSMMDDDFEIRMENRANQHMKLEVGSRQFLRLSDEAQQHLEELKRGFQEHNELEHRQGEVLSAVLGAKPRSKLRKAAVAQIGQVMGELLETDEPWEALKFLKLIHQWRDKFQPQVAGELKQVVKDCFTDQRIQMLVKQVANSDTKSRRSILQMFDALGLQQANDELVQLLAWELDEETRTDVVRYIRKQARGDLGFIEDALPTIPGDKAGPLVEILEQAMPKSRSILAGMLDQQAEPALKVRILKALHGTWEDPTEIRDRLVPLVRKGSSQLRIQAAQSLADAAPQHVYRVLEPMFTPKLTRRPDDEVEVLLKIFIRHGSTQAVNHLEGLVKRKKLANEEDVALAETIVRALIKSPTPAVIKLLESTAGDWMVAGPIRSSCKEVLKLLDR